MFKKLRDKIYNRKIEDENLLRMLTCLGARVEFFDKKYTVMAEGSAAKYIGIVLTGAANTVQVDYYGNRSILGNTYHTADCRDKRGHQPAKGSDTRLARLRSARFYARLRPQIYSH